MASARARVVAVAVVCVVVGALLGPAGVEAAKKAIGSVLIANGAKHPVPVQQQGTAQVSGTVAVSRVGGKVDTSGSTVAISGGKVDTSGSTVAIAHETPFQAHGSAYAADGTLSADASLNIPAGKQLVVTYMTAQVYGASGGILPTEVLLSGGTGTGGAALYLPMFQAGPTWSGSTMAQVVLPSGASISAIRNNGTTGWADLLYDVTGYLI
jgi:hypothetical protein